MSLFKTTAGFKLKNFNVDKSLSCQITVDRYTDSQLIELRKLNDVGEVGVILCDPEMIDDLEVLINEIKDR
jgi:hypothetical protein